MRGEGAINTNNSKNDFLLYTIEWLNGQKSRAIKTATEKWPNDYKFIAEAALWFEQITEEVCNYPPKDNVRRVIVKENVRGNVVGVDYEYYPPENPMIGEIAFRTTTDKKTNGSSK